MTLGIMGLGAQERFSLKTAAEFFVSFVVVRVSLHQIALFANTRYPSPLESAVEPLVAAFGPRILRALLLSAGAEGPRSVIPNLAELLASLVTRVPGPDMSAWLDAILAEVSLPVVVVADESQTSPTHARPPSPSRGSRASFSAPAPRARCARRCTSLRSLRADWRTRRMAMPPLSNPPRKLLGPSSVPSSTLHDTPYPRHELMSHVIDSADSAAPCCPMHGPLQVVNKAELKAELECLDLCS